MYDIRLLTIDNKEDDFFVPHKIIISRDNPDLHNLTKSLVQKYPNAEIQAAKPSTYKGVLRNVPNPPDTGDFVAIGYTEPNIESKTPRGPILVLCGLQYKGNIGTIVRTAVQSNLWEKICIVNVPNLAKPKPIETQTKTETEKVVATKNTNTKHQEEKVWEKNKNKPVTDEDVVYYSLCNAPLIDIERFLNEESFLNYATATKRKIIGVDGGTTVYGTPLNLLHPSSWELMKQKAIFVVLGSETNGLSATFLDKCDHLAMLPCLSASINVASCFAAVDTIIKISQNT